MMIVKCDTCQKVIKNYKTDYFVRDVIHTCDRCKVHLSERYEKKFWDLTELHNSTLNELIDVKRQCKEFKK